MVPASELSEALKQIRGLQRLFGKKSMENEIFNEAVAVMRSRKWLARSPLLPRDYCESGLRSPRCARSNVAVKQARPTDRQDGRSTRDTDDAGLVEEIRESIAHFPWLAAAAPSPREYWRKTASLTLV